MTSPSDTPETLQDHLPTTPDLREERLTELKRLFPDLFTNEGRLNPDELRQLVEPNEVHESERYEFKWYGKAASKREAFTPTTATLVYDETRSVNPDQANGNMIIEGENLETLKLLLNAYREQVKCIYIDPPYNIDADDIYTDNFALAADDYLKIIGDQEDGVKLTSNPDSSGRHHSNWLSMQQSRLLVAKQLLKKEGVIFISIDEGEIKNLLRLASEIFGEENYLGTIIWKGATDNNPTRIAIEHEYVVCYAKDADLCSKPWKDASDQTKQAILNVFRDLERTYESDPDALVKEYRKFIRENAETLQPLTHYTQVDDKGPYTGSRKVHNPKPGGYFYDVIHPVTNEVCVVPANGYRYPEDTLRGMITDGKILFGNDHTQIIQVKEYLEDYEAKLSSVIHSDSRSGSNELEAVLGERKIFKNPKPTSFLMEFLRFVLDEGDTFLDFYAGSGSSVHAILKHHFSTIKWIAVQYPEAPPSGSAAIQAGYKSISSITIERTKRVIEGYGDDPQPIPDAGFKVYKLRKSNFPRCEYKPDPEATEADNVVALRRYIEEKEAAYFLSLDEQEEQAVFDEVLLKNGFQLDYQRTRRDDFPDNTVYEVTDTRRSALVCLSWHEPIKDSTIKYLRELAANAEKPHFICLERSLTTTSKWNLKHFLGDHFVAF